MLIGRVIGTLVSTQKHRKFDGAKLMLVQPLNADDTPRGTALLAIDGVGAGVHEKVLIVLEGRAYWSGLLEWVRSALLGGGKIEPDDLDHFVLADGAAEVVERLSAGISARG